MDPTETNRPTCVITLLWKSPLADLLVVFESRHLYPCHINRHSLRSTKAEPYYKQHYDAAYSLKYAIQCMKECEIDELFHARENI
jgi:hypothetical protein